MKNIAGTLLISKDGQVVLQRRTNDAPTSPGKLALFGGHIEEGEKPLEAAKRELAEEVSLDVNRLNFVFVDNFTDRQQRFSTFSAIIYDTNFEVYEGLGAETYSKEEALARKDLTFSARHTINELLGR